MSAQQCENCTQAAATLWCQTCEGAMCQRCMDETHTTTFMQRHPRVPLAERAQLPPAFLPAIRAAITAIRAEIEMLADSNASVLITGPSGSGKDVVAQLLHQRSRRAVRPRTLKTNNTTGFFEGSFGRQTKLVRASVVRQ